ncbi:hypothetical protein ACFY71_19525 [Streptomyces cinerochromogenes]|uniref:hypothetical protein n=1 Tax=Streptomyces cinerochromogenes TaxID=66422 RepID=UPI0036AE5592
MEKAQVTEEPRQGAEIAVWLGAVSVGCWLCCPFWALVSCVALPAGLAGLVRCVIEHRAGGGRARAVAGGVLSLLGTAAAVAYLAYLATHPELPVQG